MGRKTWDSLPDSHRPLPNRLNVVLSKSPIVEGANDENGMIQVCSDFELALEQLSANPKVNEIFVIGGSTIYDLALTKHSDLCKLIILTRINKDFAADVFMPKIDESSTFTKLHISKTYSHKDITYDHVFLGNRSMMEHKPELIPSRLMAKYPKHAEMQYLEIIKEIIESGSKKDDRTGVGIIGKFGY